jgi:hypothetical protein
MRSCAPPIMIMYKLQFDVQARAMPELCCLIPIVAYQSHAQDFGKKLRRDISLSCHEVRRAMDLPQQRLLSNNGEAQVVVSCPSLLPPTCEKVSLLVLKNGRHACELP